MPANAELYLNELGKIVKFELLNPNSVVQMWDPNFRLEDYLVGDKLVVSKDQEALIIQDLIVFIIIGLIFLLLTAVLCIIMIVPRFRQFALK